MQTIASRRQSTYTPAVLNAKCRALRRQSDRGNRAARRAANAREDNRARLILRDSAKSGRKKFGPFNPVTVWDGVSATQRPRGFLRPPRPSLYLPLSFSPSLRSPSTLSRSFPASRARPLRYHMAHMHACMHACVHRACLPACMHASRSEDGSTRGSDRSPSPFLSLSLSRLSSASRRRGEPQLVKKLLDRLSVPS